MKRIVMLCLLPLLACTSGLLECAAADARPAAGLPRVPAGFNVEIAAQAPLVGHPLMACFDDRGRLFVADNAGLNLAADELLKQLPNMIRMLEDTDGDGRFDKSTMFADKMTFPQGAAWYRGALYVASPPSIWRLEDTDGDGVADKREELVQKFGFIGNAADIHGCFVTPTGRIAWCDGRHGHEFQAADGEAASKGLAARVFSCRPDGSGVEVFCGGGMDNPVEVDFTSEGDTIGTMTFYNPDDARHDALVHFVHGGVYPKKHPCTSEFKRTGELMPALSRFGVVAPSGLTRYASDAWGDAYRDNFYSAQFNTHKVVRHVLSRQGATFACADEEFLVSSDADFHPTDVLADADGSLLVIDTGGWFRIGCPTSQIAKPEIGGAIYRVRRQGMAAIKDPRGAAMEWQAVSDTDWADRLGDSRPAVAERALEILAQRGDAGIGTLATVLFESADYRVRQKAVWALARNGSDNARLLMRQAMADDDAPVRQAAVHAASDLRDRESLLPIISLLATDEPAVRREAATALGRLGQAAAVPALLEALKSAADRFVEHSLIYALIEINDRASTLRGLSDPSENVRRGALIALDQMDMGKLTRQDVAPLLVTSDVELQRAVVGVFAKHPDWSDELVSTVGPWLALPNPTADQLEMARGVVSALLDCRAVQQMAAAVLANESASKAARLMLLEVISAGENLKLSEAWREGIRINLGRSDEDLVRQAVMTIAAIGDASFAIELEKIGLDDARSVDLRIAAWRALAKNDHCPTDSGIAFLMRQLAHDGPLANRLAAAEALGTSKLPAEQLQPLARLVSNCGPLELTWLVRAFERDADLATGLLLVESLEKSPGMAGIAVERVREVLKNYPAEVRAAAESLLRDNGSDDQERAAQLLALEAGSESGDAGKGEDVFFSQRAACAACHRVGGRGEKIGPDLSKIGEVRTRRDLLEAVIFPSASLARGYECLHIVTKSGQIRAGLLSRETVLAVYLRTTDRAELRVERDEIDELSPSRTSIMPQGMDKVLSGLELRDLIAYLQSLK